MARVAVANHTSLSWLLLRGGLRQLAGRITAHPVLRGPATAFRTDRLLVAPQDLHTTDSIVAAEIYSGRFAFAGKVVVCDGRSVFEMEPPSDEWAATLLGFGWLRHLRAAESAITRANARALVGEWITLQGSWHPLAWRPDVLSRRIISWLSQATLLLRDADIRFYRRFVRSLVRQTRYLRRTAGDARGGVSHLQAVIALADAALCISTESRRIGSATHWLAQELERQVLPDGGHVGRDPGAIIDLLLELLPLREVYASRNIAPPPALLNAIDRMMPMLRFFRHSDGSFAHFNGMGVTPADLLSTLLAYDDSRGAPLSNAPHSGYQRLGAGGAVLIVDVGCAPPLDMSLEAHAGCLSFEFSTPKHNLLIVNCGIPPTARDEWRQLARATPAHSTVTFNDASSARFVVSPAIRRVLGGAPMMAGPSRVSVTRDDGDGREALVLRASHDGYAERFGILHERTLALAADGTRLDGEDAFFAIDRRAQLRSTRDKFAVRFHLHPSIRATRLGDGRSAMLVAPNGEAWTFMSHEGRVEIEDTVYLASADGARRAIQLVIYGYARRTANVVWSLQQTASPAPARSAGRRDRGEEPKLPL